MLIVPRVRTSQTAVNMAHALAVAFASVLGRTLQRHEGELLLAQIWQETGAGVSINNNNPGNMTANDKWPGKAWRPPWFEAPTDASTPRNKMLHAEMLAGRAPRAFRAYDSLAEGAADHMRQLRHTFPAILAAASSGDAMQYAQAIYDSRYCRDEACKAENNGPNIRRWQSQFQEKGTFSFLPLVTDPPVEEECPELDSS